MEIDNIEKRIEDGVREVFQSGMYSQYLRTMSRFHSYSFANCLLIYQQKPDATLIAGFQSWNRKFERHVKKGEKAIRILAPIKKKIRQINVEEENRYFICGYRWVSVFDVSQTEGKALPSIVEDRLEGEVDDYDSFLEALILSSRVPVRFCHLEGSAHGYFDPAAKEIVIDNCMSQLQTVKTLIHEIAHSILHASDTNVEDTARREIEAESTACLVCMHYGLDTGTYSFGYIAAWSQDQKMKLLKEGMERIRMAGSQIIQSIDTVRNPESADRHIYLPSWQKNTDILHF